MADQKTKTPRQRKIERHKSFRLTKKKKQTYKPLPSASYLLKKPTKLFFQNKRSFMGLSFVYAVLLFIFSKNFGTSFSLNNLLAEYQDVLGESVNNLQSSSEAFALLLASFNSDVRQVEGAYQMFISIIVILATIWISREVFAGNKPKIKEGFYNGMYPLVQFMLVLLVVAVQLLPAVIGAFVFGVVTSNGIASTAPEQFVWFLLFIGLFLLTVYMVISSVFALYIVTLSDVKPLEALRSARELVLHKRIGIFARLLTLPIVLIVLSALIFIPTIMFATFLAEPLFLLFSCFSLVYAVVYMYNFYRELL